MPSMGYSHNIARGGLFNVSKILCAISSEVLGPVPGHESNKLS